MNDDKLNQRIMVHFEQKTPTIRKYETMSYGCSYSRDVLPGEDLNRAMDCGFAFCRAKVAQQIDADPLAVKE